MSRSRWELLANAAALQQANPGLNVPQAISKVLEVDPTLYSPEMAPPYEYE